MTGETQELAEVQVSPLELFFDLVFVFTLTQLTPLLEHDFSWVGLAKVGLLVSVLWYMYGGFAYLTNALAPLTLAHKFFILFGMAAFFVVALAIPEAFTSGGVVFTVGYLLVVVIHFGLYLTTPHAASRKGILRIAPVNLLGTTCLLIAALTDGPVHWVMWVLAPLVMWGNGLWNLGNIYVTRPRHFVERHGLVLLIAFGESVVAVGVAADHPDLARQLKIADLIVQGMTYRQIGDKLFISAKTVEHHVARIRQRLGAVNRSDLISRLQALRHP
ncbi:low temperature requirement protein A [Kibdelosporangium lantanae]|uniref:Low temperature requirement protein A n=1 Tax=Kibdelosporangium lantanae TaxID=1497396 RepID=A0ABW3M3N1_9PSEU